MPLPDNYRESDFRRVWGEAPEWLLVLEVNGNNLATLVTQAFQDYPMNQQRHIRRDIVNRTVKLFHDSLIKYMPMLSDRSAARLKDCREKMIEACNQNSLSYAMSEISDYIAAHKDILEKEYK